MRTWTRTLVIVLGVLTATLGVWAAFAPESFYQDGPLPFIDTDWVSMLPPYNEHLVRDYGFMNLGMTVVFVVAAIKLTPAMVRTSAGALFVFGVPHTVFHSFHLDHMGAADATTQTITTSVLTVVLPAAVFLMAGGLHQAEISKQRNDTLRWARPNSGDAGSSTRSAHTVQPRQTASHRRTRP